MTEKGQLVMLEEWIKLHKGLIFKIVRAGYIRRIKAGRRFDRSIHGDLNHVISLTGYQMRFCQFIHWNLLPMAAIMIFKRLGIRKFIQGKCSNIGFACTCLLCCHQRVPGKQEKKTCAAGIKRKTGTTCMNT